MKKLFKNLLPLLLLVAGLGISTNAWGYNASNGNIYFDNTKAQWSNYINIVIGRDHDWGNGDGTYNQVIKMSNITNTKLYYKKLSWDKYDSFRFNSTSSDWNDSGTNDSPDTRATWGDNYSGDYNVDFNSGKCYLFSPQSSTKGANLDYSGEKSDYTFLNKTQTIKVMVKKAGASSYTEEKTFDNWPVTIKAKRYRLNSNGASKADETDANLTSATFTSVITSAAKIYVPTPNTGYTFKGWGTSSSATPSNASSAYEYTVEDTNTIYLFFDEITYSVTAAQGTGCASVNPTGAQTVGQITGKQFTATGETGYYFVNWTSNNGGTFTAQTSETTTFKPTGDATITANYAENTYTVTATCGEGGQSATVTTSPAGQVTGTAISATAASGYIFSGWTISSGTGSFADSKAASTTYYPTSASELEATFARATVTVNSGISGHATLSGSSKSHTVKIGTDTDVPGDEDVTFTVSNLDNGYEIEGWYTNSDYTGDKHDEGQSTYVLSSTNPNKNVYVNITPITYTITYNENGGTTQTDGTYTIESDDITLPTAAQITKTNYTFLGWYLNSDFTGEVQTQITTGSTGNKEYWAKWEETKHTVTLVNAKTGSSVQVGNVTDVTITANDPTPGYYFSGWAVTGVTEDKVTFGDNKAATTTIKVAADGATITANFAERFYLRGSENATKDPLKGMPGWGEDAKTNGLFSNISDNTATITMSLEAATEYKLKLGDLQGDCSWGGTHVFTNDADLWTFTCNAENDCAAPTFTTAIAGDYIFTIDFSEASPKMKITYPDVPDFTLSVAEARVYDETPMATFIAGNGTEANPYQFYMDEKMHLEITALPEVTGIYAWYEFGGEASTATRTKDITVNSTTPQSIEVKTYYKATRGSYVSEKKTETIYYQGVAVPALHLQSSLTKDEVELSLAPNDVTIFYTTENYTGAATITKNNETWKSVASGSQWQQTETLDKTIHSDTYVATATPNERTFTATLAVSVYNYVQVKVKDANPKWAKNVYMWKSGTDKKNAEWPGEALSTQLGDWYIFAVKYPTYDKFVVNDGKTTGKQTIDLDIPAEDICYQIGAEQSETDGKHIYNCTTGDCPNGLYVGDIANVEMNNGESATASPVVQLDPTLDEKNLSISFSYGNSGIVTATQSGTKIMLSAIKAGTTTVTATYSIAGATSVAKTFTVTVTGAVMIQAKYSDSGLGWEGATMHIHYWGTEIDKTIDLTWKGKVGEISQVYARIPLDKNNQINFQIYAWDMEANWKVTEDVTNVKTSGCYSIGVGSGKRSITRDDDNCWADYQVKIVMNNGTVYTSNTISDTEGTLSFFAPGENATGYLGGDVYLMCNGSQAAVIPASTFETSGVYTAKTDGSTLTDVALYTGDYYIRTDGADGGWNSYKTNADNKFTKFDKIETSTYDRYWVKNIKPASSGAKVNLQACVANDYNENLANKIESSLYTDGNGDVSPSTYGVNVRFGYDPSTNNFERAIIKGAGDDDFLNVIGDNVYEEKACTTLLNTQDAHSKFVDKEQWVYEKDVYVKIEAGHIESVAKLQSKAFNNAIIYQLGYEIDAHTGKATNTPKTFGLIAQGTSIGTYKIHLVYDFKTNRMVSGWSPSEDPIAGTIVLDADMLLVRKHQESAAQIKFANNESAIKQIHHIYGVMQIEKETMQNADISTYARHLYWISFPFDVKISSIFGVGTYDVEWKLQRYDGAERASKGWFLGDGTTTFWKNMTIDETLKANEGYILNLKPSAFDKDNCPVWDNHRTIATFYFPSVDGNVGIINQATYEQGVPKHECKINRTFTVEGKAGELNHQNTDSHWNVIGVPAFEDATVSAQPESESFKSYYAWDASNNTYSAGIVSNTKFNAMHAYMVQFYGKIIWSNVSVVSKPTTAPYRYADEKNYMIELFFNGNGAEDHTYINLADEASTDFVLNEDMMKIDNAGYPNIYSFAGNYNVAYNETKMDNQTVTLGVSAPKAGTYTFSMPSQFSGTAKLIDLVEGITTDLNISDYSVDLNKGTYNDRFQLLLEVEAKAPTSVEATGDRIQATGKTTKLLRNGNIYLINAGRVYNATGAELR